MDSMIYGCDDERYTGNIPDIESSQTFNEPNFAIVGQERTGMNEEITKPGLPLDESGITVEFHRYYGDAGLAGTAVIFKIPDHCQILSRNPREFMQWCYKEMMTIASQARYGL